MNEKIREHVKKYNEAKGYGITDEDIIETIRDNKKIWTGDFSGRRHWTDCLSVVKINGMLIGFNDAQTTGDDSPYDKGWEFEPESICEVAPYEVTITNYKRIELTLK